VEFIETQLDLINKIGIQNYVRLQSGSAEEPFNNSGPGDGYFANPLPFVGCMQAPGETHDSIYMRAMRCTAITAGPPP
jgi:hypothetical protein